MRTGVAGRIVLHALGRAGWKASPPRVRRRGNERLLGGWRRARCRRGRRRAGILVAVTFVIAGLGALDADVAGDEVRAVHRAGDVQSLSDCDLFTGSTLE